MRIDAARVARGGTALEVVWSGGRAQEVRWIDLAPLFGDPDPRGSRIAAARPAGPAAADLEVELAGGGIERVPGDWLVGPGERQVDLVVETAGRVMTCDGGEADPLGVVTGGAVLVGGGRIRWVGPRGEIDRSGLDLSRARRLDAGSRLVSPGLIDCHAHPVFAGDRAGEFAERAAGRSYLEIAGAGGGIAATVNPTRAASAGDLIALTCARLDRALAWGTTTMEAKSGYDLTIEGELRMLEVARAADALHAVDLEPTLLGAHALPPDRAGEPDLRARYVAEVAEQMIPRAAAAGLCRAVDVYCDQGAFTRDETRRILDAARAAGLLLRAHVGQFADLGAAELVAELGGLSVDHVEKISQAGASALAAHSVVAVMLPGACVQLRLAPPPVAMLRRAGVALAVASDLNPGSSLSEALPIQMWLATTHYGMTVEEAWLGVTRIAARALGRADLGWLGPGAAGDLVIWEAEHPAEVPYHYGANRVLRVIKSGRPVRTG
jgi:imidazolonepropionase